MADTNKRTLEDPEGPTTSKMKRAADGGYGKESRMWNTLINVEGQQLHVNKELLSQSSPVFKQLFDSTFRETQTDPPTVSLPTKSLDHVIWLLDFIYPNRECILNDKKAVALLPLSDEYQIDKLKAACVEELMKQEVPQLLHITLAQRHNADDLMKKSMETCAIKLSPESLDAQLSLNINSALSDAVMLKIYQLKVAEADHFLLDVYHQLREGETYDDNCECGNKVTRDAWERELEKVKDAIDRHSKKFGNGVRHYGHEKKYITSDDS